MLHSALLLAPLCPSPHLWNTGSYMSWLHFPLDLPSKAPRCYFPPPCDAGVAGFSPGGCPVRRQDRGSFYRSPRGARSDSTRAPPAPRPARAVISALHVILNAQTQADHAQNPPEFICFSTTGLYFK